MAAHCTDSPSVYADNNVRFYERFARQYDLFFRDPENSMSEEGAWIGDVLRHWQAVTVLDACCGTGRQAIPLAKAGFQVIGADPSGAMLGEAAQKAQNAGVDLVTVQTTFASLPRRFRGQFDAILAMGNGLCNVPTRGAVSQALAALRRCCTADGVCLVGTKDFDSIRRGRERFHARRFVVDGGQTRILFEVWEYQDPHLSCTAFLLNGDADSSAAWTLESHTTREYMAGSAELYALAKQSGFSRIERLDHPSEAVYLLRP